LLPLALGNTKLKEKLPELLFNLASADRLALLGEIATKRQTLTDLSKAINASRPECSRHLARLKKTGLITKDSDGLYQTTAVGTAILEILPSLQFLLEHRDNLLRYDLSQLPLPFLERIGELSGGDYVDHFSLMLELIKKVISTGREHVWVLSDKPVIVGSSPGAAFSSRDIPARLITGANVDHKVVNEAKSVLRHGEFATLPQVKVAVAMNESLAWVCFAGPDGKIDFGGGFSGKDAQFRGWCSDLFEYYWARAKRIYTPF
jgi:predicted transcriptional regulator